uniref:Enhancer of rudimentary homolog n=1 Tax=Rhizophora mucronata TaxID=61149 RepID=A0A2P2KSU0_RHIMU
MITLFRLFFHMIGSGSNGGHYSTLRSKHIEQDMICGMPITMVTWINFSIKRMCMGFRIKDL